MDDTKIVWLIDDCETTLQVHQRVIYTSGFAKTVVTFNYAGDALRALTEPGQDRGPHPKVIFVDVNMPLMNGWKFLEEFERLSRSMKQEISVFLLSSCHDEDNIKKAKNFECVTGFISKPLTLPKIESMWKA